MGRFTDLLSSAELDAHRAVLRELCAWADEQSSKIRQPTAAVPADNGKVNTVNPANSVPAKSNNLSLQNHARTKGWSWEAEDVAGNVATRVGARISDIAWGPFEPPAGGAKRFSVYPAPAVAAADDARVETTNESEPAAAT